MDQAGDPVDLVREVWRGQARLLGEPMLKMAAANPSKALAAAGSGGADEALRFDMKLAVEAIVAALNIAKLAIDAWKTWKTANRAVTADLDALIRSKVDVPGICGTS